MLYACLCCLVISAEQQRSVICYMFVCVASLSQLSSRDLSYVICLCVLPRYLSRVVEICHMLYVCVCFPRYLCCLVISAEQQRSVICYMFVCVASLSQQSSRDLSYVICLCVLPRYLSRVVEICHMLYACLCCLVISAEQQRSVICYMLVCVASLSQQSSREICYMFVCVASLSQQSSRDLSYVICLCVLPRYLSGVVSEICHMLYVICLFVLPRYLSRVVEICHMLYVCLCCLVISAEQQRSVICYMFVCVASLSQQSSRDLSYVICLCVLRYLVVEICHMLYACVVLPRYLSRVVEICHMLYVCVCCLVISAEQQRSVICYMFVCVASLSQLRVVISAEQQRSVICYMFVCVASLSQQSSRDLSYVICLCVLPRYLS